MKEARPSHGVAVRPRTWLALCALLAVTGAGPVLLAQGIRGTDGLSIQRTVLPPAQVAKEMERVQQGSLVLLPLAEFEARLERAKKILDVGDARPRLVRADYTAELIDGALRNGSGQWSIVHTGVGAAILPVAPLQIAIERLRWDPGETALLGELDGKALGLFLPKPGNAKVAFEWSARGNVTSDGITFSLAVPACPITTFELALPADQWLTALKDTAVVAPQAGATPVKRLWKVQAVGVKPVELLIRRVSEAKGTTPTLFARLHTEERWFKNRVELDHEFVVDVLHGSIRTLTLDGDAGLQPYDVSVKNGDVGSWQWKEATVKKDAKGKPATGELAIHFHQPVQGKNVFVRVRSLALKPEAAPWISPSLRVRGALSRGETLSVQLPSDLSGRWEHGTFRPMNIETKSDGSQILNLADAAMAATVSRRPTWWPPVTDVDLFTRETSQWRLTPRGASLRSEIEYSTSRGKVFELRLKLPSTFPGYAIESIQLQPPELLRRWYVNGEILFVELKEPLERKRSVVLQIELRGTSRAWTQTGRTLSFPAVSPLGVLHREGMVAVHVDPVLPAQLVFSSVPIAPQTQKAEDGNTPSWRFAFRDQSMRATVRLMPQATDLKWQGKNSITLSEAGAGMRFHWKVEPNVGAPEFLDFRLSPGFPPGWRLTKDEDSPIHHWERLPLNEALPHLLHLGCRNDLQSAALQAMLPVGTYWRFHLTEPLRKSAELTLEANSPLAWFDDDLARWALQMPSPEPWQIAAAHLASRMLPKSSGERQWLLPLMAPVHGSQIEQDLKIESLQEPISKVAPGASMGWAPQGNKSERMAARLRSQQSASAPGMQGRPIIVWTRPEANTTSLLEVCDEAEIASYVQSNGREYHRIQFRLWHGRDRTCALRLPPNLHVMSVRVAGRWLERIDVEHTPSDVRLNLPVDQNTEFNRYEIIARVDSGLGILPGLAKFRFPHIHWPATPIEERKRLFLESGLKPLTDTSAALIGTPERVVVDTQTPRRLRQVWNWGQGYWPFGAAAAERRTLEKQRQLILLAEAHVRERLAKEVTLGEAVARLAMDELKTGPPLVIDRIAFHQQGVQADTKIPDSAGARSGKPFWESLGLTLVASSTAALLTSPKRMQELGLANQLPPTPLDKALLEAILHGRDATGGFMLITTWLESSDDFHDSAPLTRSSSNGEGDWPTMSEWVLPPGADQSSIWIVYAWPARFVGWVLALLIGAGFWQFGKVFSALVAFRSSVVLLAAMILFTAALPGDVSEFLGWPSLLITVVAFLTNGLRLIYRRAEVPAEGKSTAREMPAVAAILGLLFLSTWSASAQGPATRTYSVLILEGPNASALVPPELMAKLAEVEKRTQPIVQGAVFLGARYRGVVKDGSAAFEADFDIHAFTEKASLVVPLTGVQLQEGALLDGAPVFPSAAKNGFAVTIRTKGLHRLRLVFTVNSTAVGELQELQFGIPKLVESEMSVLWPTSAAGVYCPACLGAEKIEDSPVGKTWHGQLGYQPNVFLRWTKPAPAPAKKAIEIKEAHFWDLRPASRMLFTSFQYSLGKNSVSQFLIGLPDSLQVRAVDVLSTSAGSAAPAPVALKQWNILGKGAARRLAVDLNQPLSGNVILNVDIVSSQPQKPQVFLALPTPLQGSSSGGFLAYRMDALEIQPGAQNLAVQSIGVDDFDQQWKKHAAPPIPAASRAYAFQRRGIQAGLELKIAHNEPSAQLNVQWNLEPQFADLNVKCTINAASEDLTQLEFFVDKSIVLKEVKGSDVHHWYRHDTLLQIWLRQARKQTAVEITGWREENTNLWKIANVFPMQARLTETSLEVRAPADHHLRTEALNGLRVIPGGTSRFTIEQVPFDASFRLVPQSRVAAADSLTVVRGVDQGIEYMHGIRIKTQRGVVPPLTLQLAGPMDTTLRLNAPGAVVQPLKGGGGRWTIKYPPGLPAEVFVTLSGRLPAKKDQTLPEATLKGAETLHRRIAWQGVELIHAKSAKKITPQRGKEPALGALIEHWLKDPSSWKIAEAPDIALQINPLKASARGQARVVSWIEDTHRISPTAWMTDSFAWVFAQEATEMRLRFPSAVEMLNVYVDGRLHAVRKSAADEVTIPLEAAAEPRGIRMVWKYTPEGKPRGTPNLAGPRLELPPLAPPTRRIWFLPGSVESHLEGSPTLLATLYSEAKAHAQVIAILTQESPLAFGLANHQERLRACVRHADYLLAAGRGVLDETDAAGWSERWQELKREDAAVLQRRDQKGLQKKAITGGHGPLTVLQHTPPGIPRIVSPGAPGLPAQAIEDRRHVERDAALKWTLLGAIGVLVFSFFRRGWLVLRLMLPEFISALVGVALYFGGFSLIGVLIIVGMVILRGVGIVEILRRGVRLRQLPADDRTAPPGPMPAT